MVTKFLLIRHAKPILSEKKVYGNSDTKIFSFGLESVHPIIKDFALNNSVWVSSPLYRTLETAKLIINLLNLNTNLITDQRLKEQDYGEFEGKNVSELPILTEKKRSFWHIPHNYRPEKGESFDDVIIRSKELIEEYVVKFDKQNVILVTHGGVIRAIITYLLNIPVENAAMLDLRPLSCTILTHQEQDWNIHGIGL